MWYAYLLLPAGIAAALLWRWWRVRQFRRLASKWASTGTAVLGELTAEIEGDQTPRSNNSSFPRRTVEKVEIVATPDARYCLTQRIRPSPGLWPRRLHLYTGRTALYNDARMTPRLGAATHAVSKIAIDGRQVQILIEWPPAPFFALRNTRLLTLHADHASGLLPTLQRFQRNW